MSKMLHSLALDLLLACAIGMLALISFGVTPGPMSGAFLSDAAHMATMMGLTLAGTYGLVTMFLREERLLLFPVRVGVLVAGAFLGLVAPFSVVALLA